MSSHKRWWQTVLAAFLLVLIVSAWIVFAPLQVGGQAAYVIITGNSMEPGFLLGDLVIVRQVPVFQVGDIVAYRNEELKSYVFHRIIGVNLDHYILKGDNNTWIDSYQPTHEELVGKLWIRIPDAGNIVKWLRTPIIMAILAGSLGIIVMVTLLGRSKHGRAIKKQPQTTILATVSSDWKPIPSEDKKLKDMGGVIEGSLYILGFIALASLVLGVFAFTRPVWRTVADNITYQQSGAFSYSAKAPAGVYDSTMIESGQPVFPKLTCTLTMDFTYALTGNEPEGLAGTYQITARVLEERSGWQRTLPIQQETSFSGNTFTSSNILNLCQIEVLVSAMEEKTAFRAGFYTLEILPFVTISGKMAGRELQDTFESRLVFRFDQLQFYLTRDNENTDPLSSTQSGMLAGSRIEANTLSLFGADPKVSDLRTASLIGLVSSLTGLLILLAIFSALARRNQESFALMKYGSMLIDVQDNDIEMPSQVIDVITLDDLVKLAARNNSAILHQARPGYHHYLVQESGIIYRYVTSEANDDLSPVALVQLENELRRGIKRKEFRVLYQPIISLMDGRITAVEALLRWQHPQRGLISPAEFLPVAEATGMIEPLGEWMLQNACSQLQEWQKAGASLNLAVNLSERQLEGDPVKVFSRVLQNTGTDPQTLQIEFQEIRAIENIHKILPRLQELRNLGMQISMDNFIGESSLSSLEQFPLSSVKIDRSFVEKINNPENAILVRKLIAAALSFGLNVVAEGVETEEQLIFLRSHLCTLAQGYLLSRPIPAQEMTQLLWKNNPARNMAF